MSSNPSSDPVARVGGPLGLVITYPPAVTYDMIFSRDYICRIYISNNKNKSQINIIVSAGIDHSLIDNTTNSRQKHG